MLANRHIHHIRLCWQDHCLEVCKNISKENWQADTGERRPQSHRHGYINLLNVCYSQVLLARSSGDYGDYGVQY